MALPKSIENWLILFADGLGVGFSVWVEKFFASLLPSGSQVRGGDVPVGAAFLSDSPEVLAEIFERGAAEEPIAVVYLVDDQTGFENDDMRNHRVIDGIGVFSDVEVFLDYAARV